MSRQSARSVSDRRNNKLLSRVVAALCWAGAGAGGLFMAWTALSGHLNAINFMVILSAIISLSAFGILSLSGDLAWNAGNLDEGQVAASRSAQSLAFNIAYLGVTGLWIGYLLFPQWRADVTVHLGLLSLVITCVWFGAWTWQRWHG